MSSRPGRRNGQRRLCLYLPGGEGPVLSEGHLPAPRVRGIATPGGDFLMSVLPPARPPRPAPRLNPTQHSQWENAAEWTTSCCVLHGWKALDKLRSSALKADLPLIL
ncbi:unnamed protein product [Boreogadus saida]